MSVHRQPSARQPLPGAAAHPVTPSRDHAESRRSKETQRLLSEATNVDPDTRRSLLERVVLLNKEIADSVAGRFVNRGIELDDLRQVAYLALINAAHRYDPARGTDFLSFAVPTMRGEIQRHFRDTGWAVRPSRRAQELHSQLITLRPKLAQDLGREPDTEQIAACLDVDRALVEEVLAMDRCRYYSPLSLDADYTDGSGAPSTRPLSEYIGTDQTELTRIEGRATIAPLIARLQPRERLILRLRFFDDWSQQRIAERLGISQMQVSRQLRTILTKLRDQAAFDNDPAERRVSA